MSTPDNDDPIWGQSVVGDGVQVVRHNDHILIRNPREPDCILELTQEAWVATYRHMRNGDYDYDRIMRRRFNERLTVSLARSVVRLAAKLAGQKRGHLREAWLGDVTRAFQDGQLTVSLACRTVDGYIACAIRLRLRDLRIACWQLLGLVLISPWRTHLAICLLLGSWGSKIYIDQGFDGLTADLVNFGIAWTALGAGTNRLRARLPASVKGKSSPESADHESGKLE